MRICILFIFAFSHLNLAGQTQITGTIMDKKKNPLAGANIYIEGTYQGATSNEAGHYEITTGLTGDIVLIVNYIGYEEMRKSLVLNGGAIQYHFQLKEKINELNAAVITAGTFEAGDKKRSALLKPLDIVTTAGAEGDIYNALNTLPGAQKQQESGKIIVRGGAAHETKSYMDGLIITSPYTSTHDDIPSRGRFSPFLFDGILFSTGGYSAEYGQALSSVIALHTNGLADENITGINLLNVGGGVSHTHRWDNSSLSLDANYSNLTPYFKMAQHTLDWIDEPESEEITLRFNKQTKNEGLIKTYGMYNSSNSALNYPNYTTHAKDHIGLNNTVLFAKTSYEQTIGKKWFLKTGIAFFNEFDKKEINAYELEDQLTGMHTRYTFSNYVNDKVTLKFGSEFMFMGNTLTYCEDSALSCMKQAFADGLASSFVEGNVKISNHIALRIGGRMEYSSYTKGFNGAPRLAMAIKANNYSQVSLAYGLFYQQPQNQYLLLFSQLNFESAEHYIINFQISKNNRTGRVEAYYKKYKNLICYDATIPYQYENLNNKGHGYARGVDIFWRDKKTIKYTDYWISYSFIDTRRKYLDYEETAPLDFVSKHNVSVVCKYWISVLNTQLSTTYTWNSGRFYNDPNDNEFMKKRTKSFNTWNGSLSYITALLKQFTIVHFSINNILGTENIYGYHFETQRNDEDVYVSHPIIPYAKRTYVLAIFISIQ